MRAIFMGTPEFAVPSLHALQGLPDVEVVGVVTRRDRPAGRGRALEPPPIKRAALDLNLPVLQPGSLRKPDAQATLRDLAPDVVVVAAFGQILPPEVLALPRHGCLNVHASLLPRFRGASPIAAAILDGVPETGNTIMLMDEGLDTGAILAQEALLVAPDDTTASLTAQLAHQGAVLLARTLPRWIAGEITPQPQDDSQASLTRLIRKEDGIADWAQPAAIIERRVRAFTPWPGTQTTWNGQLLKVVAAHLPSPEERSTVNVPDHARPGMVITGGRGASARVGIVCGEHSLLIADMLQLAGKRAMPATEVIRGQPALVGSVLPS